MLYSLYNILFKYFIIINSLYNFAVAGAAAAAAAAAGPDRSGNPDSGLAQGLAKIRIPAWRKSGFPIFGIFVKFHNGDSCL